MEKFKFIETGIEGLLVIEPAVLIDDRGYFMETWNYRDFGAAGLNMQFVQDNHSTSTKGVLRGLHYQKNNPQGKLVRVISGEVFDVAVDIRKNSKTFGEWYGITLSSENKKIFYIPEGFAHGFLVTGNKAEFMYKCTRYYDPSDEYGIIWNDPSIKINWPLHGIIPKLSGKDKAYSPLSNS